MKLFTRKPPQMPDRQALNLLGDGLNDALNPRLRRYIP